MSYHDLLALTIAYHFVSGNFVQAVVLLRYSKRQKTDLQLAAIVKANNSLKDLAHLGQDAKAVVYRDPFVSV